tara:strand:- start:8601 stop:9290 length:690 start_codon:yes stop_codon:yes gene_type:complete
MKFTPFGSTNIATAILLLTSIKEELDPRDTAVIDNAIEQMRRADKIMGNLQDANIKLCKDNSTFASNCCELEQEVHELATKCDEHSANSNTWANRASKLENDLALLRDENRSLDAMFEAEKSTVIQMEGIRRRHIQHIQELQDKVARESEATNRAYEARNLAQEERDHVHEIMSGQLAQLEEDFRTVQDMKEDLKQDLITMHNRAQTDKEERSAYLKSTLAAIFSHLRR